MSKGEQGAVIDCIIGDRVAHNRSHAGSIGGHVYEDEHWIAYHVPVQTATVGQLFLVAKRHNLDFAEMTAAEAGSYGPVLNTRSATLKAVTGADRIYALVTLEGVTHFHVWLIPCRAEETVRG